MSWQLCLGFVVVSHNLICIATEPDCFAPIIHTGSETTTTTAEQFHHKSTQSQKKTASVTQEGPVEKEEWTFWGLTKIDIISIVVPAVVAIPSESVSALNILITYCSCMLCYIYIPN